MYMNIKYIYLALKIKPITHDFIYFDLDLSLNPIIAISLSLQVKIPTMPNH